MELIRHSTDILVVISVSITHIRNAILPRAGDAIQTKIL